MLKFKPEDFGFIQEIGRHSNFYEAKIDIANIAQQIFDAWIKDNGIMVHGCKEESGLGWMMSEKQHEAYTHKALLINIEPIEKCSHPTDKVQWVTSSFVQESWFRCECGAKVRPKEFEVIDS